MIDLDFSFQFLKGRYHGNQILTKSANDLHSAGWRSETCRNMAVLIQKYSMAIL